MFVITGCLVARNNYVQKLHRSSTLPLGSIISLLWCPSCRCVGKSAGEVGDCNLIVANSEDIFFVLSWVPPMTAALAIRHVPG